ncbi:MAG: ATP-dependent metallopeptidase FtsH/Yme1/Tma family protein, partial [Gemmatimonadales bacterium]
MPDRLPPPRQQGPDWASVSKSAALWAMIILAALFLFNVMGRQRSGVEEFTYTAFRAQLDAGNVATAKYITGGADQHIEGDFKAPVTTADGRSAHGYTVLLPVGNSEQLLTALDNAKVQVSAKEDTGTFATILIGLLPYVLIFALAIFFLRQMQAGGNRAFSFGKSKAKLLTGDTPKITFADVAGADEAKVELQEIIEFLKDPQKFTRLGGRLPKGALLVGAPGTGKTLLAKA